MNRRYAACVMWLGCLVCPLKMTPDPITSLAAQTSAARSVRDGVFTEQQAARGQAEYMQACAACHSEDLRGRSTAPSLVDEDFAFQWGDMSVGDLFTKTRTLMPSDRPGSLPGQTYADIIAFVLKRNGFPAGDKELAPELEALSRIRILTKRP